MTLKEVFEKKKLHGPKVPSKALQDVIDNMRWMIPPLPAEEDVGFSLNVRGMNLKDACPKCFALRYCGRELLFQVGPFHVQHLAMLAL